MARSVLDTAPDVKSAIDQLDAGYFRSASLLVEQMMRDDRIRGVVGQRVDALISSPVVVKPGNPKVKAERIARDLGGFESDGGIEMAGEWEQIAPPDECWRLSFWGLMLGVGVAQQVYTTTDRRWTPHLIGWHPQFLRWDWLTMSYWLMTANAGEIQLPRLDQPGFISNGQWVVYTPFGYREGWKYSAVKWLADKYIMRGWDYRDWARYNEAHGQPQIIAYVPERAKAEDQDAYVEELANSNGERIIKIPVGDGGKEAGWGAQMLEPTARTYDSFAQMKGAIDTDIAIGVLGENLTTQIGGGGGAGSGGSHAAAKEHTLVRIDKALFDARLAQVLRAQVLVPWARFNHGDESLAPRPEWQVEPAEDENAEATTAGAVGDAAQKLAMASPSFNVDAFLDRFGMPLFSPEELAGQASAGSTGELDLTPSAQGAVITVNEARRSKGLGPLASDGGAEDPDGFLSVAEYLAKHSEVLGQAADAEAGVSDAPQGAGGQPPAGDLGAPSEPKALGERRVTRRAKRYLFQGLPIAVENPAGSIRTWSDADGKQTGQTLMLHDYGFIEGHARRRRRRGRLLRGSRPGGARRPRGAPARRARLQGVRRGQGLPRVLLGGCCA
jgi:hypothetical protein